MSRQIASRIKNLPFFHGTTVTPSVSFPSWTPCIGNRPVHCRKLGKKDKKKANKKKRKAQQLSSTTNSWNEKKRKRRKRKKKVKKKMKKKKKKITA